jgi:hypothetical protein
MLNDIKKMIAVVIEHVTDTGIIMNQHIGALPDNRWRPMHTAPRDGTVFEVSERGQAVPIFGRVDDTPEADPDVRLTFRTHDRKYLLNCDNLVCWRPAHPEWNDEP